MKSYQIKFVVLHDFQLLLQGQGLPDLYTRILLNRISISFPIEIVAMVDGDPGGALLNYFKDKHLHYVSNKIKF